MLTEKDKIELELKFLEYSRYVSRAHTIFSSSSEIIMAIIFGVIGIVASLVEVRYIVEFNKFHFIRTLLYTILIIVIVLSIAIYKWYESRIIRANLVKQIQDLQKKA